MSTGRGQVFSGYFSDRARAHFRAAAVLLFASVPAVARADQGVARPSRASPERQSIASNAATSTAALSAEASGAGARSALWGRAREPDQAAEGGAPEDRRLADANAALAAGDAARALTLLGESAGALDDYRSLLRGQALLALGKNEAAYAALTPVKPRASRCPNAPRLDHPLYADAVRLEAKILGEQEPIAAAELLLGLQQHTPELLSQALDLYRRAGDTTRAESIEATLLLEAPDSPDARALEKQLHAAGVKKRLPTPEARLDRVRRLLETNQNLAARNEATALLAELAKDDEHRCELAFITGKAERKLREYASSAKSLAAARERCLHDKNEELALKAALIEVQVRTIRGDLKEAKKLSAWMAKTYPAHSFVDDALMFLANAYDDAGSAKEAKRIYVQIADEMKDADQAPEALWRLAYLAIRAGETADATKRLEAILARADLPGVERARARYWLARAIEKKDGARAKTLDEDNVLSLSFYGWLTLEHLHQTNAARAEELEKKLRAIRDAEVKSAEELGPASILRAPEYDRARRLAALGASIYAQGELELIACSNASDEEALALALGFDAIGAHPRAQQILRARQATMLAGPIRPETLRVWRAAYSRPFAAQIEKAASESKVEPSFLIALVREESTFDPEIVSWAGAVGLAQLMPGTAMLAHLALKLGRLDPDRLTDPELNLRLGARVLKDGLSDFGSSEPLALVAYNGGPGVAKKLIDDKPKPFDRWVEEIQVRETRRYVKRVLETWGIYRYLYDAERPFIALPASIGGAKT